MANCQACNVAGNTNANSNSNTDCHCDAKAQPVTTIAPRAATAGHSNTKAVTALWSGDYYRDVVTAVGTQHKPQLDRARIMFNASGWFGCN